MKFDRSFEIHNVRVTPGGLVADARVFDLWEEEDAPVARLSHGAFTKALKDRKGQIRVRVEAEEIPGVAEVRGEVLRLGIACDGPKATELSGQPLELRLEGRIVQEADEDGARSITEVSVEQIEVRSSRPTEVLRDEFEERLERYRREGVAE